MLHDVDSVMTRVDRKKLEEIVTRNRAKHAEAYGEALRAYQTTCITAMREKADALEACSLEELDAGSFAKLTTFSLPAPKNYLDDYDAVLGMLAMSVDDTLELTGAQINAWCYDRWSWQREFVASTRNYVNRR